MDPIVKWALLAVLTALAAGYFGVVVWRPRVLAGILLRRGYAARGWDETRLARRILSVGWLGLVVSAVGFATAVARAIECAA